MAKVLVVDDEKLIVKGIRFSLEQEGMEVDCAYDGIEAIERAKAVFPSFGLAARIIKFPADIPFRISSSRENPVCERFSKSCLSLL